MKKIVFCILILFLPFIVSAANIKSVTIDGNSSVNFNNDVTLQVNIDLSDIKTGEDNDMGLLSLDYRIIFDDSMLTPVSISTNDFNSVLYKKDNAYYVYSYVVSLDGGIISAKNACSFDETYCGTYTMNLKFKAIKNTSTTTNIEVKDIEAKLLDYKEEKEEYDENDIISVSNKTSSSFRLNIKKTSDSNSTSSASSIVSEEIKEKEISIKKDENKQRETKMPKSSNANIESLTISKYNLDFNRDILEYDLEVDYNTNKLNIDVKTEDTRSTFLILGAEDLNFYGGKVRIIVTAEDNTKKEYVINVTKKKEEKKEEEKTFKEKITEKARENKTVGYIIVGNLLIIIILIAIIGKMNNKKIDKYLDKL